MATGRVSPVFAHPIRAWFLRARSSVPMACSYAQLDFPAELSLMVGVRLRVHRSSLVLAHGRRCLPSCAAPDLAVCSPDRMLALLGHAACCTCVCSLPAPKLQVCQSTARRQFAANVRSPVSPCVRPPARRDGSSPLAGRRSPICHGQRIDALLQQPVMEL
jgi:hypothetical protein